MARKFCVLLAVLLAMSLLFSACTSTASKDSADDDVIRIGVFEPMTGANAAGGELEVEGVRLAKRLYPEALGKEIELVIVDNKSDPVDAASAAALLVEKEKVAAIIGSWGSSLAMAAGDIIRDKVPTVGASCTNPLVTLDNDWYFRVCFIDPFQGKVMATYSYEKLGAKKAAIVQEINNDYAVGLAKFYIDSFIELTGDDDAIVAVTNYNTGDQDFSAQLTNILSAKPDVIFAPGNYTESALIVKQARLLGIEAPILGGDTYETPEFVDIGGDAVEGTVFSTFFTSETPITKESEIFLREYRDEYGKEPAAVTALAYDAYILILDAIERAGTTDPVALRNAISETTDFEGAAGIITLDENGDAVKNAVIKQVKNGEFVYMDTIEPK